MVADKHDALLDFDLVEYGPESQIPPEVPEQSVVAYAQQTGGLVGAEVQIGDTVRQHGGRHAAGHTHSPRRRPPVRQATAPTMRASYGPAVTSQTWRADAISSARRPAEVLGAAVGVGLLFQLLFWGAAPGISFPVFVLGLLGAIWWVADREGMPAAGSSLAISAASLLLASTVAVRAEPMTGAVNGLVAVGLLAVLVQAFGSERWLRYGMRDWLLAALRLSGHEVTGAPALVAEAQRRRTTQTSWRGRAAPVLRGVALAAPIVLLLGALLAAADTVFAAKLTSAAVVLPRMDEAAGRLLLALIVAYLVAGGLWHLVQREDGPILADQAVPRLLGFTEAAVVLASVNLLFATFVVVQLRYFFGGQAGIVDGGLTFAEYARRGFGELVVVAAISLGLHLALAGLTQRETHVQRWLFTALTAALSCMVLVILASAFQRLLLYEAAFGFTRLRTFVHVFMVWLGVLLVVLVVLELADRVRLFLLAGIIAVAGFALTLNVIGVDALIARHNVARAVAGAELDTWYLASLSPDAVPTLVAALPSLNEPLAAVVADVVRCIQSDSRSGDWRSLRLSDHRAQAAVPVSLTGPPSGDVCS